MNIKITPAKLTGSITAVPSKSDAHRKLICAALADKSTLLSACGVSQDILCTIGCLSTLGAGIRASKLEVDVHPITEPRENPLLDCCESGSTLRFLLPVAAALCENSGFTGHGRLPERPLGPLIEELEKHGATFSSTSIPLSMTKLVRGGRFNLPGEISSQYVTGLLLAAPLMEGSTDIRLTTPLESAAYVDITITAMREFGVCVTRTDNGFYVAGGQRYMSPGFSQIDGDWSNSAFWLTAGALNGCIDCTGLSSASSQGDRAAMDILRSMGGRITSSPRGVLRASSSELRSTEIDASSIPDLVPVLAVGASVARGTTKIVNAARLRLKESDRLRTTTAMLSALGADISLTGDGFTIKGRPHLVGGTVSSAGDHRIAMSAAVAACTCSSPVIITGAECVAKSYPQFWDDYRMLGGIADVI